MLLDHPRVAAFDAAADTALDRIRGDELADRVFYGLSEAANHSVLWHLCTWVPVLFERRSVADAAKISVGLGIESALVNGVIKQAFRRERPVHTTERPHKLRKPKTSSFPSGHATSAFFAIAVLGPHRVATPWRLLAVAVATSRAYVRIHHASDVLGGIATGVVLGAIGKRMLR